MERSAVRFVLLAAIVLLLQCGCGQADEGEEAPADAEAAEVAAENAETADDVAEEGAAPPEGGAAAPDDGAEVAEEGAAAPDGDAEVAAEGAAPADDGAEVAGEDANPAEGGAEVAGEGANPAEGGAEVAGEGSNPAEGGAEVAGEGANPAEGGAEVAEENAAPADSGAEATTENDDAVAEAPSNGQKPNEAAPDDTCDEDCAAEGSTTIKPAEAGIANETTESTTVDQSNEGVEGDNGTESGTTGEVAENNIDEPGTKPPPGECETQDQSVEGPADYSNVDYWDVTTLAPVPDDCPEECPEAPFQVLANCSGSLLKFDNLCYYYKHKCERPRYLCTLYCCLAPGTATHFATINDCDDVCGW